MSIERKPHGKLAVIWSVWYALVMVALAMPGRPYFGLGVLLAFLPIEAYGVFKDTGARDTLSEITTWVFRRLSKHTRVARGWNALLLACVLMISYLFGRTVWYFSGSWPLAVALGGLFVVWLYDHLLRPDIHG